MSSILKHIIYFVLIFDNVNSITLLEPRVLVQEGNSYFQMVTDTNLAISNCTAAFKQNNTEISVSLDLHSNNLNFSDNFEDTFNFKNRIESLGFGRCGFKVYNSSFQDPMKWVFMVANSVPGQIFYASFTVGMYKKQQVAPLHSVKPVHLGIKTYLSCGIDYTPRLYCYLFNPEGEFVSNECTYSFIPTPEDIGIWTCKVIVIQSIEALKYTIDVKIEGKSTSHYWVDETDDYISFGCRIKNWKRYKPPANCVMTSPSGEILLIKPGHATTRYTSVYTDLKENICGVEIKKPLLHSEQGPWTCEMGNRGNVIFVGNETDYKFKNVTLKPIKVNDGENFVFRCKVPDSYSYCFITNPVGNRLEPTVITRAELGECSSVSTGQKAYNGTWTCTFIKDNEMDAFIQKRDVIVNVKTCVDNIDVQRGNDVSISCKTGRDPIQFCWFISPEKKVYNLKPGFINSNVSYVGKGLEHGDCGIKIHNAQDIDNGYWVSIMLVNLQKTTRSIKVNIKN